MDLTDQQWHLLQPLFADYNPHNPSNSQEVGGRPPIQPRPILDSILWKIRNDAPWYNLPRVTGGLPPACPASLREAAEDLPERYPSHQTCYRRYRQWRRDRLLDSILLTLYDDLLTRGNFDPQRALRDSSIIVTFQENRFRIFTAAEILDTWQLSTTLIFIQLALTWLKQHSSFNI